MMHSFYNGISGVKTHSFGMDLVANNITNVNTVGFKAAIPEFKDLFYETNVSLGIAGSSQLGLSATGLGSTFSQKQGALEISDRLFDIAIEGKGFFGIKDAFNKTFYTRNGGFSIDSNHHLVDSFGRRVLGSMNFGMKEETVPDAIKEMFGDNKITKGHTLANTLDINLNEVGDQTELTFPDFLYINAEPTKTMHIKANINKYSNRVSKEFVINDIELNFNNGISTISKENLEPNTRFFIEYNDKKGKQKLEVFTDENGNLQKSIEGAIELKKVYCIKTVDEPILNKFISKAYMADGEVNNINVEIRNIKDLHFEVIAKMIDDNNNVIDTKTGSLYFNANGSFRLSEVTEIGGVKLDFGTAGDDFKGGYNGLVCIDNANIATQVETDGYPAGILREYNIDDYGNIIANFTNGRSQALAKLAIYNFINEQGLTKVGENAFEVSRDSGMPIFFKNEDGSIKHSYVLKSHYLEQSNVDLGNELTQLIVLQKAFDANSKSISTADQMLKRAIEMKK